MVCTWLHQAQAPVHGMKRTDLSMGMYKCAAFWLVRTWLGFVSQRKQAR